MRKATSAAVAALAIAAVPVASNAAAPDADRAVAKRGTQFTVSFTLRSRGNDPVALKRFRFKRLTAVCNGGATVRTRGFIPHIKVKSNNKFAKTMRRNGKKVRVAGRVKNNLRKVKGTIFVKGNFAGQTGCASGKQRWVAN